jgi:hypothetical protein
MSDAIPVDVDDVTPEWLGSVLDADVQRVDIVDKHSGTTGRVRVSAIIDGHAQPLFVKLAPFDERQRKFVDMTGLGIAEARFYRELAPEVPLRIPVVHHAAVDNNRYVMVLEDLGASGCRFPTPRDPDIATTTGSIVEELAVLHAQFWASPRLTTDLDWVAQGNRVAFGSGAMFVEMALDQFGEEMGPAFRKLAQLHINHHREVAQILSDAGVHTLIHGDAHLGNLFVDGNRAGFFDWAMIFRAPGMRDIAYVLGNSIPTDVRRANEREWLARYRGVLADHGVDLDEATMWEQYRLLVAYSWNSATSTAAMGSRWQEASVGQGGMRRATAAIEDLETVELLEARLG